MAVGRPARISRADIVDAVLELGFDAATASAVARRLRVDTSTLYGHVKNTADMLDAAAEAAVAGAPWPAPTGPWRDYLIACAEAMWAMFEATPGLAHRLRTMVSVPPSLARLSAEVTTHLLAELHCDVRFAVLIIDTIGDMTIDSHLTVEALDAPVPGVPGAPTGREQALRHAGSGPYAEVLRDAMGEPGAPGTWWRDKLDLVLDGIAYRLERG
ncbi:TetR/AcrR family transcriptional regulator [Catenuloplanes japonicus]|uniref:TetR/AcrR family transcriptional regulator n=1 Tax=Catenuloplanes japonicus TaxID=33876 RepID=UPI00068A56B3|nr:TetR family transcriptional regulator [Catenuloplanes japonicus]